MTKITKNQTIQNIASQLKGLEFDDRIPNRQKMNETVLKKIQSYFGKSVITPTTIREIIGDYAFQEVLDKTNYEDPKTKGLVKFENFPEVDAASLAKTIFEFISKLPEDYYFVLKLPKCEVNFKQVSFTHNITLLVLNENKIYFKRNS